jgi:hypothetical protein
LSPLAARLDRLITCWPQLPLETKVRIAKAKNSTVLANLLPPSRTVT